MIKKKIALFNNKRHEIFCSYIRPYQWEYLFGGIFVLIILFSEMYFDFFATYRASLDFWYALFEGHPLSFYSYAEVIPGATPNRILADGAGYDFTIYAFFAIWNFPAWIYERLSGNYAESCFLCLAWGKLMFPMLAIMIARGMKKILSFVTKNEKDTPVMLYTFFFSGILIMTVYFIGQYDIIGVLFAIYGVYYFLTKDYKRFYLYFGVAITCKYLAVFLFVCLILFHEKRILYIIRDMLCGCYLLIIEKVLFSFGRSYESILHTITVQTVARKTMPGPLIIGGINSLFHVKAYMGVEVVSVFMFLLALIWGYCYLQKEEDTYQFYYKVIYIAFSIYTVFLLYTASVPFRAILLLPYLMLMIYCRNDHRKFNLMLETVGVGSFMVWHLAREPYFFHSQNCEGMLLYYLLGKPAFYQGGLSPAMTHLAEEGGILFSPINMIRSVFYVCMLLLLIFNFPSFQTQKTSSDNTDEHKEVGMRGLLIFRIICNIGVLMLPLAGYIAQVVLHEYFCTLQTDNLIIQDILPFFLN